MFTAPVYHGVRAMSKATVCTEIGPVWDSESALLQIGRVQGAAVIVRIPECPLSHVHWTFSLNYTILIRGFAAGWRVSTELFDVSPAWLHGWFYSGTELSRGPPRCRARRSFPDIPLRCKRETVLSPIRMDEKQDNDRSHIIENRQS